MILAKEENIVKEWCYAVSSKGVKETKHTLTVTNKRVISESKNNNKTVREELPINLIKGISCSTKFYSTLSTIFLTIGIILAISSILLLFSNFYFIVKIISIFIFSLSISFIIVGIELKRGSFLLIFYTNQRYNKTHLSICSTSPLFKLFNIKRLFIKINKEVSQDILDTIGAIIIDCQNGNTNTPNTDSNFDL